MKKRIYVRIGLAVAAVATLYVPNAIHARYVFSARQPSIFWHYKSEIDVAFQTLWFPSLAFITSFFFLTLLSRAPLRSICRAALAAVIAMAVTIPPALLSAFFGYLILDTDTFQWSFDVVAKVAVGITVYAVLVFFAWRWAVRLPAWRDTTADWKFWRYPVFFALSGFCVAILTFFPVARGLAATPL